MAPPMKTKQEIEAKRAELNARLEAGKVKRQAAALMVTAQITALEWVLGIPSTFTDKEHVL